MSALQSETVVEAFTELAPRYEASIDRELRQFWGLSYEAFVKGFVTRAPVQQGDLVLDLATGTAAIPLRLASAVGVDGSVVGLDLTPAMLAHGLRHVEETAGCQCVRLVCGSAMALPFTDGLFDGVLCALGTHHMDVPCMLAEARRVLRDGGTLLVADVGASSFWRSSMGGVLLRALMVGYGIRYRSARARAELEAFGNVRTAEEWQALLEGLDFVAIEIEETRARRPWYPSGLVIRATTDGQYANRAGQLRPAYTT